LLDELDRLVSGSRLRDLLVGSGDCEDAPDDGLGSELEDEEVAAGLGGGRGTKECVDD
jgi:hypothetical protein